MKAINPYINFDGTCENAFNFYKSVFGGEFTNLDRFSDVPEDVQNEFKPSENDANKIMHISLPMGNDVLMGSDIPEQMSHMTIGNNFAVSIDAESEEEANKLFAALSDGGKVLMPLGKTFWGSLYGMFFDKYGVTWMVSYNYEQ